MLCSTLLPYENALTDPLMRCPIALYPSTFDHHSPPSPATQQASRAHDKRDLYNTCIVSQLSRNKYCLNQTLGIVNKQIKQKIKLNFVDYMPFTYSFVGLLIVQRSNKDIFFLFGLKAGVVFSNKARKLRCFSLFKQIIGH